jgi:NAD(P)-dependent dehydrogenase (short-subunit alcohol dehydrogenase family)
MGQLEGKVAVITGAASGIGKATAALFAREGAKVVLADLNVAGGEEAARLASEMGARCVFQRADASSEADIAAMVKRALDEFGRLDVMFNNAGVRGAIGRIELIAVEDWDRTQAVVLRSVFLGIKHSIEPMRAQGGGSIISNASSAGLRGFPGLPAYGAAKAGVINLTRSAAIQLGADNIRVNAIAPGNIITPLTYGILNADRAAESQPIPRAGQSEDIANAALYLASDAASFVTGHTLVVDGGLNAGELSNAPKPGQPRVAAHRAFVGPSFED